MVKEGFDADLASIFKPVDLGRKPKFNFLFVGSQLLL